MSTNSTPRTWGSGEVVTAAQLNAEVRDFARGVQAAWDTWDPVFTNLTKGNATIKARFLRLGKTVLYQLSFVAGSTTTFAGGSLVWSLPVPPHGSMVPAVDPLGTAFLTDSSAGIGSRTGATVYLNTVSSGGTAAMVADRNAGGVVNGATPWAWANGDSFAAQGMYEAE